MDIGLGVKVHKHIVSTPTARELSGSEWHFELFCKMQKRVTCYLICGHKSPVELNIIAIV